MSIQCSFLTWWHHPMTADRMYVCMFMCFKSFSVLTFNAININQYNPPKQKPFGHSQWFKSIKGLWDQKVWKATQGINFLISTPPADSKLMKYMFSESMASDPLALICSQQRTLCSALRHGYCFVHDFIQRLWSCLHVLPDSDGRDYSHHGRILPCWEAHLIMGCVGSLCYTVISLVSNALSTLNHSFQRDYR